ncbi:MAG: sulfatase [Kiritimatiellae bacterium]|nr:sulfatase [Kiritimatiellia bacterium]
MNRPMLLFLLLAVVARGAPGLPDTSRMNILLIDIEDCNAAALGCYGNPICRTPNLDRLCASGVRFDAAYVQGIACNPSRTSFLTGLRPRTTGVLSNQDVMEKHLPPGTITLPEALKAAGFQLANVGKLFHGDYGLRRLAAFDRLEHCQRPPGWSGPPPILSFPARNRSVAQNPPPRDTNSAEYREWKRRMSDRYGDSGLDWEEEGDYRMAATAAALIREYAKTGQRFFLSVAQSRPHTPLLAPKRFLQMYDSEKIPDPPAPPSALRHFPYMRRATGGNPDIFTQRQPSPREAREAIAAYYACLSMVDANVGLLLDALDQTGLATNTIVVFLADHGFHLGDHGFWSKYSMLEATHRAPLIVRVPGAPGNGRPCRSFVEFIDLMPTLCELAGVRLPPNLEGISFAPLLADPDRPWKTAVFITEGDSERGDGVRTAKYRYLEFEKGEMTAALFDLERDPWETNNVADDPAYAQIRAEMASLLRAGWRAALPAGVAVPPAAGGTLP